jgi:hypothetical protein
MQMRDEEDYIARAEVLKDESLQALPFEEKKKRRFR